MDKLIDVTHTVKASEAPSEGARYMFNPKTGERFWTNDGQSNPEVPPVPMPTKGRKKRGA